MGLDLVVTRALLENVHAKRVIDCLAFICHADYLALQLRQLVANAASRDGAVCEDNLSGLVEITAKSLGTNGLSQALAIGSRPSPNHKLVVGAISVDKSGKRIHTVLEYFGVVHAL